MDQRHLVFDSVRRFGVELEVNSFDSLDRPLLDDKLPEGIHYVGNIVARTVKEYTEIRKWGWTTWERSNGYWVVKPDGSCGLEICSPVVKGWKGLEPICRVSEAFGKDETIKADKRCSVHAHVDISDLTPQELHTVLTYWIKCEPVFMDAVPDWRKMNRYCQFIGMWDWFKPDTVLTTGELIKLLGRQKYLSLNTYHLDEGRRQTIEFRLCENRGSKSPFIVKNWVRLMIHFVEMARRRPPVEPYKAGDPWSSWLWLDPEHVFQLLGFDGSYTLSDGMRQVRDWFVARLTENITNLHFGVQSVKGRRIAHTQIFKLAERLIQEGYSLSHALCPLDLDQALYGKIYQT